MVTVAVVVSMPKAQERSSMLYFLAMALKGRPRREKEEFPFSGVKRKRENRGADGIERRGSV